MGFKAYRFVGIKTRVVDVVVTGSAGRHCGYWESWCPSSLVSR